MALAGSALGPADVSAQVVERVGEGLTPAVSGDGRVVAFGGGVAGVPGLVVYDRVTRTTTLVSVSDTGTPGNGASTHPRPNGDGRVVAFKSRATNLVPGGTTPSRSHIYVRDRAAGTTTLVSVAPGGAEGNGDSFDPAISADGRFAAFGSAATNLVPGGTTPGVIHTYVRNLVAGTTELVSVASGVGSGSPALSADGRLVAFASLDGNIYVRDRLAGTTELVSVASDGTLGNNGSTQPSISADGRIVAFVSQATNLASPCTNNFAGTLGPNGHVLVRDRTTGTTTCVIVSSNGVQGNGVSSPQGVSADGRFVTFSSEASNLVPGDTNGIRDIFVHDRATAITTRVSVTSDGTQADRPSCPSSANICASAVSGDGRVVVFDSEATNLVPGDTNGRSDVFVARLAAGPNWLVAGLVQGLAGSPAQVRGFDALGNPTPLAFDPGLAGGVHVALGDVNGDGAPDLLVGAGDAPGQLPLVRVFSGSTAETLLVEFDANPGAPGGVTVAACDLEGTGRATLITGPGPGGGTQVRVWRFEPAAGTVTPLASFPAYATSPGGVRVACGALDGPDAPSSIITGPGPGSAPLVRVFTVNLATGTATERLEFLAFPASATGGVSVAVGDVRRRGRAAIVTGPGPGFPPLVRVWRLLPAAAPGRPAAGAAQPTGETVGEDASLMAYGQDATGGVNVATGDPTGLGGTSVVTGPGPDPTTLPQINTFDVGGDTPQQTQTVLAGDPTFHSGVAPTAPPATAAAGTPASASTSFTLLVTKAGPGTGTVAATPAGVACGVATCAGSYLAGTVVTLSASPAEAFAGWEGCDALAPPTCTVTLTATRFVTATFTGATSPLVAAVLPTSRSVQVGTAATAFATIINTGTSTALECALAPTTTLPATFSFQTTDPATNQLTGTPNTPVAIPAGGAQSFVLALTPSSAMAPTEVAFSFDCSNTTPAASLVGVNTLLLSASATPVPDIIAVAATPGNTGIVEIPGVAGTGVFAVATSNVGATGSITVSADTGSVSLPLQLTLCETNAATGVCLAPPAPTVTVPYAGGSTRSFGVFAQGTGAAIAFDPAVNRVFVRFRDAGGVVRGATSVAVRTQ